MPSDWDTRLSKYNEFKFVKKVEAGYAQQEFVIVESKVSDLVSGISRAMGLVTEDEIREKSKKNKLKKSKSMRKKLTNKLNNLTNKLNNLKFMPGGCWGQDRRGRVEGRQIPN